MSIDREALLEQLRRDTKSGATTLAVRTLERLIDRACQLIPKNAVIITHSRSSAVMGLFRRLAGQRHPFEVIATLGSPGNEGALVASELNDLAVPVTLITESQIGLFIKRADIVISGRIDKTGLHPQAKVPSQG